MTGLISFIMLALGGLFMLAAGGLYEEGSKGASRVGGVVAVILLLCGWWLA